MARKRNPSRDKAYEMWKARGGEEAPKGVLKEIAQELDVSEANIRSWKKRDKWESVTKDKSKCNVTKSKTSRNKTKEDVTQGKAVRKKKLAEAKALVENGASLSEAAKQTEVPVGTLSRHSASEGWIDKQIENLTAFQEEVAEEIKVNKRNRLKLNKGFIWCINEEYKMVKDATRMMSKGLQEKLKLNQETENLILGIDRLEKMIAGRNKHLLEEDKMILEATKYQNDLIMKQAELVIKSEDLRLRKKKAGEGGEEYEDSGIDSATQDSDIELLEEYGDLIQEE